jgi:hypothetical protein
MTEEQLNTFKICLSQKGGDALKYVKGGVKFKEIELVRLFIIVDLFEHYLRTLDCLDNSVSGSTYTKIFTNLLTKSCRDCITADVSVDSTESPPQKPTNTMVTQSDVDIVTQNNELIGL